MVPFLLSPSEHFPLSEYFPPRLFFSVFHTFTRIMEVLAPEDGNCPRAHLAASSGGGKAAAGKGGKKAGKAAPPAGRGR